MAKASVEILGNASSFVSSVAQSRAAIGSLVGDLDALTVDVTAGANAQVAASARKITKLRAEMVAYREVAAAAKVGSTEQIAAASLAERAQSRLAAVTGETAVKTEAMAVSSQHAERDILSAARGAAFSTGIFRGLGRSLAFAGGGFVAFAGAGEFLKASVDAARGSEVAQRQLAAQIKTTGTSISIWQGQIDKAGLSLAKYGFTSEDAATSLTFLVRATGSVTTALRVNTAAAELARATGRTLTQSALILGKAYDGQTSSLKRMGVELPKGAKGMEAVNAAAEKFAGQAAAGTTEAQRFAATLHDSEVIIGDGLLPVLNRYLADGAKWLDQMNRTGRLQKDVNSAVHGFEETVSAAKAILGPFVTGFKALGTVLGGTKNELEVLGLAFLTLEARAKLIKWGLIETGIASVGAKSAVAEGEVAGLAGGLSRLAAIGLITIPIEIILNRKGIDSAVSGLLDKAGLPGGTNSMNAQQVIAGLGSSDSFTRDAARKFLPAAMRQLRAEGKVYGPPVPGSSSGASSSATAMSGVDQFLGTFNSLGSMLKVPGATPLTSSQNLKNALIANPNNTTVLSQQIEHDKAALAFAAKQRQEGKITNAQYEADYANYMGDLVSREQTITSITHAAASKIAGETKKQAEARKKAAAAAAAELKLEMHGYTADFTSRSLDRAFTRNALSQQFTGTGQALGAHYQLSGAVQLATAKDTALGNTAGLTALAHEEVKAAKKALASGMLSIQAQTDAWNIIDQANQQIGTGAAQTIMPSARKVLAGIKFASLHAKKMAEGRVAQLEAHGGRLALNVPAVQEVHAHLYIDGREIAASVTKHQQKTAKRQSASTRNGVAGSNLGLH